jgi:hypothetical protein
MQVRDSRRYDHSSTPSIAISPELSDERLCQPLAALEKFAFP